MYGSRYQALILLACALAACSSAPTRLNPDKDAYWMDPRWLGMLLTAVQSVVRAPDDAADPSTPMIHGTVKFTLLPDGAISYPEIVKSTGNPELDKLMIDQVASAQAPKPVGQHADDPHDFELELDMPTPFQSFESSVYKAIDDWKIYPRESIIGREIGSTVVDFDYLDGKSNNITIAQSSNYKELDKASVSAVTKANLPSPPTAYAGKTFHMVAIVCYSMNYSPNCPTASNVILVQATLVRR